MFTQQGKNQIISTAEKEETHTIQQKEQPKEALSEVPYKPGPTVEINTYRIETVNAMYKTINQLQKMIHSPDPDPVVQTQSLWMVVQRFLKIYTDMMRSLQIKSYLEKNLQTIVDLSPEEFLKKAKELAESVHKQIPCASLSILESPV